MDTRTRGNGLKAFQRITRALRPSSSTRVFSVTSLTYKVTAEYVATIEDTRVKMHHCDAKALSSKLKTTHRFDVFSK